MYREDEGQGMVWQEVFRRCFREVLGGVTQKVQGYFRTIMVSDPILSCTNLQDPLIHFFSNPEDLMVQFRVWESDLPLCIVPQVFHFPELVVWCTEHFSPDSSSIVFEQLSQIVINIYRESITKMLGLHITRFPD